MSGSLDRKVAFLGGGRMGEALVSGLIRSGGRSVDEIMVTCRRDERARELAGKYGIAASLDNAEAAGFAKVLTIPEPLYQHRHSHSSTRLDSTQPERIERATDLMYRCVEALDRGSDYEDLLAERSEATKVDPRVFRARGHTIAGSSASAFS